MSAPLPLPIAVRATAASDFEGSRGNGKWWGWSDAKCALEYLFWTGRITAATHSDAVTIPVEALVPEGEGFTVFVVDSAGIAHARPVTVGGRTDKVAEIRDGVAAGERVVTEGAYGVQDSARVQAPPGTAGPAAAR